MAGVLDDLAPAEAGAAAIKLQRASTTQARAFSPVDIAVSIEALATEAARVGLSTPLELTVTPPTASGFERRVFRRAVPSVVTFTPREGGLHLVRLREVGHNRWWGAIEIDVAGERTRA